MRMTLPWKGGDLSLAPVQLYERRLPQHSQLAFKPYFREYRIIPVSSATQFEAKHSIGVDRAGCYVVPRSAVRPGAKPTIVAFHNPHPSDVEAACYSLLLESEPFNSEADLLPNGVTTYFQRCMQLNLFELEAGEHIQKVRSYGYSPVEQLHGA